MNVHQPTARNGQLNRRRLLTGGLAGMVWPAMHLRAQGVGPDIASNDWTILANGEGGRLKLHHLNHGEVGGTMYSPNDTLRGYFCTSTSELVLVRSRGGNTGQVFVGQVSPNRLVISGAFYALSTYWGASMVKNCFGFAATRPPWGNPTQPNPTLGTANRECLPPYFTVANRPAEYKQGWTLPLSFTQSGFSCVGQDLTGTIADESFLGHYAPQTGSLVFLRMRYGLPFQFYRGQVTGGGIFQPPLRIAGDFYALTVEAGASTQRMKFDWATL